ncbi:polysaccharide deacetylase family protein [Bosea sp. WAO]|uniref:polysaccharide deacetylase family protein n=1 Tax=Bosea sp. WAO TaxID=406341 RepID=UPI00082BD08E|nr:polysaccharide deacetylase family protein [Bosea sp. WAO]
MSTGADWADLLAELDRWALAGRRIALWLRDDDAVAPSGQLDRLAALGERFTVPVLLASIPLLAEEPLARRLESAPMLFPCQHGVTHENHAPAPQKKAEVGNHRPPDVALAEIAQGWRRLRELFGARALPVFVPPWNRIDPAIALALPGIGLAGLSCFRKFSLGAPGSPVLVNTDLDLIDWHGGRAGRHANDLLAEMLALLVQRRTRMAGDTQFGLLLHHRDHDAACWAFLEELLARIGSHAAIDFVTPQALFALPVDLERAAAGAMVAGSIGAFSVPRRPSDPPAEDATRDVP